MKVECEKAEMALGFTHATKMAALQLELMANSPLGKPAAGLSENYRSLRQRIEKAEEDWELYKKPGFYRDRPIRVVGSLPNPVEDETLYVVFHETGYELRSGRNFIDSSMIAYGNLRYGCVDLEHPITDGEKGNVLRELVRLNNGKIVGK